MPQLEELKAETSRASLFRQGFIPDWLDRIFLRSVTPIIAALSSSGVHPNVITTCGFLLTLGAATLIVTEFLTLAGLVIVIAGICDFVDGKVAARTHQTSVFGAIYDSVLDRYSDMALCLALGVYFLRQGSSTGMLIATLALIGSVMTSYIKAVGEARGFTFRVGCSRRQERMSILCIGLIFSSAHTTLVAWLSQRFEALAGTLAAIPNLPVMLAVFVLALTSNVTALQRLLALRRLARSQSEG